MTRFRCFLGVALISTGTLLAGQQPEPDTVYVYSCQRTTTPPAIDGKLDDVCWQEASVMTNFHVLYADPVLAPKQTIARALHDDKALYIGMRFLDSDIAKLKATCAERDGPVYWDDSYEVYIETGHTHSAYYKVSTNFLATKADIRTVKGSIGIAYDSGWGLGGEWQVATTKDEGGWQAEIALPFSDLGAAPKPGDLWTFQIVRFATTSGQFQASSWSPRGSYATPEDYGHMLFDGEVSGGNKQLAKQLSSYHGTRWQIVTDDGVLLYDGGEVTFTDHRASLAGSLKVAKVSVTEAAEAATALPSINAECEKILEELAPLRSRLDTISVGLASDAEATVADLLNWQLELAKLTKQADELRWRALSLKLLATVGG